MLAIYKREVKSYFISMIGYAFIAFLLLVIGFVYSSINIDGASPFIGYALQQAYVSVVFMLLVPVVTMRVLADEHKTKTDQLLFTAPVSITKIVLAKYLGTLTLFAVPMLVVCIYPIMLTSFGTVPMPMSYVSILGFVLLGMAYFAIGILVSAATENQIISSVITFAVLILSFSMQYLVEITSTTALFSFICFIVLALAVSALYYSFTRNLLAAGILAAVLEIAIVVVYIVKSSLFEGLICKIMLVICLNEHYDNFMNGYFEVDAVVYYLSVVVICLVGAVQMLQKRKYN
jgi:ABC-2 type transport system permease protein